MKSLTTFLLGLLCPSLAFAEGPTITSVFPSGGAPGTTVEVKVQGGGVSTAREVFITGDGVSAEILTVRAKELRVKKWHLLGPFDNKGDKGFDKEFPPELEAFDPKKSYVVPGGHRIKWQDYDPAGGALVQLHAVFPGNDMVAYAFGYIDSRKALRNASFVVAGDDGYKVWVNGQLKVSNHNHLPIGANRREFKADLKRGRNAVLVKVDQGYGEWEFELRQTNMIELPGKKIHEKKCGGCHGLRSPANRLMTARQWARTVWRMVRQKKAPITDEEAKKIVEYLQDASRKTGMTLNVQIAEDAAPGPREIRLSTASGVSTAWAFEVGPHREVLEAEPNSEDSPQELELPVTINGVIANNADKDIFTFQAKEGERLIFNVQSYRINEISQGFFNPWISLHNAAGEEVARNTGYFGLDPLIDYTAEEDGRYTLILRDLLYRGSPGCVYRLAVGPISYNTYIHPAGGRPGQKIKAVIGGENIKNRKYTFTVPQTWREGIHELGTPYGVFKFMVNKHPSVLENKSSGQPQHIDVPSSVNGRISQPGEVDRYRFAVKETTAIQSWMVIQPFPNNDERGLDDVFPPEHEINFDKVYKGKGGRPIKWYKSTSRGGNDIFTNVPEDGCIGYALTYINSKTDRDAILQIGSDDGVKVWVNDEVVWVNHLHRPMVPAEDVVSVRFKKGRNKILVKVENGYGDWGMVCAIDGYTFEAITDRLGSPLRPMLSLLDGAGKVIASASGGGQGARLQYSFSTPGEYELQLSDVADAGGRAYLYRLNATALAPDFEMTVTPDNPNIARGATIPLEVRITRRIGLSVPIELAVTNLPAGVVASKTSIPIDQTSGILTLTAARDAPFESSPIEVIGRARVGRRIIARVARPYQIYRTNNQPQRFFRRGMAASVVKSVPYALAIVNKPEELVISKDRLSIKLKVKAVRYPGFNRQIVLQLGGLPAGIQGPRTTIIPPKKDTVELELKADIGNIQAGGRGNLFVARTPGTGVYQVAVMGVIGRDSFLSSPAVTIRVQEDKARKPGKLTMK